MDADELVCSRSRARGSEPPGGTFAYSSTDYVLLGLIAQKAGGAALGDQLRDRLFDPLGLRRTSFEPGDLHGDYVHGYRAPSHQGVVTGAPVDIGAEPARWTWAAGGIVSTPGDVQRFFAALLRGRMLGPAVLREMEPWCLPGANGTASGSRRSRPRADPPGATRATSRARSPLHNTRDASRQLVLVVNTYPLSGELEAAVRRAQLEAFCDGS